MKAIKTLGVIALFGVVIYMALGLKQRIVQTTCNEVGDYKATKGEEIMGANSEEWYCCPPKKDKTTDNCMYYGE